MKIINGSNERILFRIQLEYSVNRIGHYVELNPNTDKKHRIVIFIQNENNWLLCHFRFAFCLFYLWKYGNEFRPQVPLHANQNNFRMKNFARGPPLQQRVNTVNRGTISEKAFRTTPRLSILLNAVFLFSVITGRLPFLRRNVIVLKFELIPEKSSKT